MLFKKHFLLLAIAATLFVSITPSIASQAHDGDDENGEEIIVLPDIQEGGCYTRMPALIPIIATLVKASSLIYIELLYPVDDLSVTLTNLVTADSTTFTLGATQNNYIPITLGCGLYRIEFTINNETNYYGFFHL